MGGEQDQSWWEISVYSSKLGGQPWAKTGSAQEKFLQE